MIISLFFFSFLFISTIIYWIIPKQNLRTIFLSISSFIFIGYFDINAVILILSLCTYSFIFAGLISKKKQKKLFHRIGVIGILLILIIFKYLGLLVHTYNQIILFIGNFPQVSFENILLPLGISYITFKLISYLTDVYWKITGKGNFIDLLAYSSLFTIYTAGPIERFEKFYPQLNKKNAFDLKFIETAFKRIVYGLFKKLVIADWIAYFISKTQEHQTNYSNGVKILILIGFSIQIYTDFAGYSDIAIGSSYLFGIKIMENFDKPYFQKNITEFWRHWHISLSDWIRDYIFFPLSTMFENKLWRIIIVPLIAMALCGLWHGASWNFMIWGLWHGAGIAIYQTWLYLKKRNKIKGFMNKSFNRITGTLITFLYVTAGWWWFR